MNSTLNHIFRVVWCKVRLTWIAVSEAVSGQGKVQSNARRTSRPAAGAGQSQRANTRAFWDGKQFILITLPPHPVRATARWQAAAVWAASQAPRTLMATAIVSGSAVTAQPAPSALPTGGQVSAGQASISQSGASMVVQQGSDRAAINWQSFNVGKDAQVQFQQPGASSVILNRVMSADPSQIFGRITANGQVILSNPSGVYFGASARVDVGALIATTHSIGDADFMDGKNRFERNDSTASVVNEGELKASLGGYIALLAPEVRNQGAIIAQMGTVALAAGEAFDLHFDSNNRLTSIRVEPSQIQALVDNRLAVRAPGGLIVLSAQSVDRLLGGVVQNSGHIEASGIEQQGGRIMLSASSTVKNSGVLDASSAQGQGGSISVLGDHIELQNGTRIDASGAIGGGTVLVGGDWQGSNGVQQAVTVNMASGASIDASATVQGNGGTAVLWSDIANPDSVTVAQGTILANGGAQGGDGGHIETSGHWLQVDGAVVNASAVKGRGGEWLLDPQNVTVSDTFDNNYNTSDSGGTKTYQPNNDVSNINVGTIATALNGGTSVTLTTGTSGSQLGDLTVNSAITKSTGNSDVTLTLRAANSIVINRDILHTGGTGKMNLVIDADNNNPGSTGNTSPTRDGGGIVILEANLSTGGGSLTFGGTEVSGFNGGDLFVGGTSGITIATSGGAVDVKGNLLIANSSNDGFTINTSGGGINLRRAVDSGNQYTAVMSQLTWQDAFNDARTRGGWLATIGSSLENSLAIRAASYSAAWLGGQRIIGTNLWQWTADPTYNATTNPMTFFYQGSATEKQLGGTDSGYGGTTASGYFNNWSGWTNGSTTVSEPNNWNGSPGVFSQDYETVLQFTGSQGKWNDLPRTVLNSEVQRYVLETNLAPSRLNLNAGSGAVAIGGGVGFSKALSQLNVNSGSTSVAGGGIITTGAQSYSSALTVENTGRVEISGTTVTTQGPVSFKSTLNDVYLNAAFTNTGTTSSTFNAEAARHIQVGSNTSIASSTAVMNTSLWADTDKSGDGIVFFEGSSIATKGGTLTFGKSGQTLAGSTVLVGGDVFFQRGSAQTLTTGGGALNIYGETIVANASGLNINSSNGNVTLHGLLNSGNQYTWVNKVANSGSGTWDAARTEAKNGTGGGSATGDSYLVNITSRLENAIAGLTAGYQGAWIGAYRPNTSNHNWAWADGTESGQVFFTQNSTGGGGTTSAGFYANFGTGEPNGALSGNRADVESVGQFFGSAGLWNDLHHTTTYANNSAGSEYAVKGFVRETNLAGSPVVINAGTGAVQIQGGVGTAKALNSLTVTSSGTTVKGNGLITTGAQSYSSSLTVNDSNYIQAVNLQAGAGGMTVGGAMTVYGGSFEAIQLNTDITSTASGDLKFIGTDSIGWSVRLGTGKTITKSAGTGTLTFAGPGRIENYGTLQATGTAVLNVVMSAETDNGSTYGVGTGTISTNGGDVWIGGGSLTNTWNGMTVGSRWASGANTGGNANAIDISGNITTGGGDVLMSGWTAHPSGSDITANGAARTISAGSGNVTLLSRTSKFANATDYKTTISTTGTLTLAPLSGQGYNLVDLTVNGTSASGNITGTEDINGLVIQNVANLSGLVFGSYLGSGTAGDTAYNNQNGSSTTVDAALSINGAISLFGTDVNINQNLNTSTAGAGGDVLAKATANIVLADSKSITTSGGDVTLWANSDGQSTNGGVFFKSSSAVSTSGGHIWVGGGSGTTSWNGLTVGDGWAVSGRGISDMGYVLAGGGGDWQSGVGMNQTTFSSGGGNIYIAGQRNASSPDIGAGFLNYSGASGTLVDAGAGTVTIKGSNTAAGSNVFGVMTGLHPTAYVGKFVVKSANTSAANAIVLEGTSSAGTGDGVLIENHTRLLSTAYSGGGGISISGTSSGGRNALSVGIGANPGTLDALSASGKIDVNVGTHPLLIASNGNFKIGSVDLDLDVASSTANVVITSNGVNWAGSVPVRTTGALTIKPAAGNSFSAPFNTQSLNYTGITALTIGHAQNTGGVTIGSATAIAGPISIYGGAINIASALTSSLTATHSSIALYATGAVTQSAALTANSLALNGSGNYTLTHVSNSVSTVTAGSSTARIGSMQLVNAGALTVGDTSSGIWSVGDVKVETLTGDLTVSQNINTLSASATAVVLNAGKSTSAGTDTGGDIKLTGTTLPTISTANGGRVTAFTGSLSGSTSLVDASGLSDLSGLVKSGSGRFRYGSDETATNYSAALGAGAYVVYREQPSLTVTADSQTIIYGDSPQLTTTSSGTGKNGDTLAMAVPNAPTATVFDSGDTTAVAASDSGTAYYDAGTYTLRVGTMATSALGYALTTATGSLTVNKKAATITADNAATIYSLSDPALTVSYTGLASGETSITDATRTTTRAPGAAVNDYAITVAGAAATDNYTLTYVPGTFTIAPVQKLLVTVGQTTSSYGAEAVYTATSAKYVSGGTEIALVLTDATGGGASDGFIFTDGANNTVTLKIDGVGTRNSSGFFNVGTQGLQALDVVRGIAGITEVGATISGSLNVTPKLISLSETKVYDGNRAFSGTLSTGVGSETLSYTNAQANSANVLGATHFTAMTLVNGASSGLTSNYALPSLAAANDNNAVAITARPLALVASKVYDGSTTMAASAISFNAISGNVNSGLVAGETLLVTGATGDSAHAATASYIKTLTLADANGLATNYSLPSLAANADNSLTITARALDISLANTNVSKVYDGNTDAKVANGALVNTAFVPQFLVRNAVDGDATTLTYSMAYNSANVVGATALNLTSISLTGFSASTATSLTTDYNWNTSTSVAASITARPVAVLGTGVSKVYDGTTSMSNVSVGFTTVSGQAESGVVSGQALTVSGGIGAFTSASAGAGVGYSLTSTSDSPLVLTAGSGTLASNYSIPGGGAGTITGADGKIYQRPLNITFTGDTKVYDGSTSATVTASYANAAYAPVAGDDLTINRSAAYLTKDVGSADGRVAVSSVNLSGSEAGNYTLTYGSTNPLHSPSVGTNAGYNTSAYGSITQLDSVTWVGVSGGNWFNPANWAVTGDTSVTGVVPDLANVAKVVIPTGVTVNFNSTATGLAVATSPVSLTSLQGSGATLNMSAGALNIGSSGNGGSTLAGFMQSAGAVTGTGSFEVTDTFSQTGGTIATTGSRANVSINQTTGALGWTDISAGGNLSATSQGNLTLGATNVGGDLTLDAGGKVTFGVITVDGNLTSTTRGAGAAGGVVQTGKVVIKGSASFIADTGTLQDAALTNAANDFQGTVSFTNASGGSWRNVTVKDADSLTLGNVDASGNLNATAGVDINLNGTLRANTLDLTATTGDITQNSGTLTVLTGPANLTAGDDIQLDKANDFNGTVNASGDDIALNDVNSLTLGNINARGDLDATAGVDINLNGTIQANTLDLTATTGDITQNSGTLTVLTGPTNLTAGDDIKLDKANDFNGEVNASGDDITLNDVNSLSLGDIDASGNLNATAIVDLNLDGTIRANTLDLKATTGDINQNSGTLTVLTGPTNLTAGDDIKLDKANDFNGTVNASGDDIALNDVNSLTLGNINARGDLDATAGVNINLNGTIQANTLDLTATTGDINQNSGTLTVLTGPTNLAAGDDIKLDKANDFNGEVNALGDDISLNDVNGLTLGDVTASGDLTLASVGPLDLGTSTVGGRLNANSGGGDITQSGPLQVEGPSSLVAGAGSVELMNAGNRLPKGAKIKAARYAIAGEGNRMAQAAESQVQGSRNATSLRGTGVASATSPTALVTTSSSSASDTAVSTGDTTGSGVDLRSSASTAMPSMMAVSMPRGTSTVGTGFSFALPQSIRDLAQGGVPLSAEMSDGSPLPGWLRIDPASLEIRVTAVPFGGLPLQLNLNVAGQRIVLMISERQD